MEENYKYVTIENILDNIYNKKKIRVFGSIMKINQIERMLTLSFDDKEIECEVSEESITNLKHGLYVQILGTVIPSSPAPRISAKIIRILDGIDEGSYMAGIKKFRSVFYKDD